MNIMVTLFGRLTELARPETPSTAPAPASVALPVLGPLPGRADPPVSAWERDIGMRRGARIAIDVAVDERQDRPMDERCERLEPALRRLTATQHELVARALDRSVAHRDRRMARD